MDSSAFARILRSLPELTPSQREQLLTHVRFDAPAVVALLIENHPKDCPHCHEEALRPWGSSHGLPRFRCRACGKTSNPLTGTPLARLRMRERWLEYALCLNDGLTVRRAAAQCQVNKNTAFLWRHRFLKLIADMRPEKEHGIVEADETFFLKSYKGQRNLPWPARQRGGVSKTKGGGSEDQVSVLIVRDRSGKTADYMLKKLDAAHVTTALDSILDKDACLCTDRAGVYLSYAKSKRIRHEPIKASGPRRRGPFHIQNVNAYDSRLKGWISRFRGVATKYLGNYLGWHRMLDRHKYRPSSEQCLFEAVGWGSTVT
ncbi:IS1595 family transposase [Ferrimonas sp. YFM]|uniref:IS1595 family transposase n=1 Tax=Ferrimonas sp. YFM TaxID=3028878 RepID=UPI002574376E|nr:IS1595 family transposase [Ferrimonas sp. YFM]BDY05413.1 transposase [Ferrimonas sp. YFM]BDY05823.1 transposase [Ferrimonas sp. YFM]